MNLVEKTTVAKKVVVTEAMNRPLVNTYEEEISLALRSEKDVLFQFRANIQQLEDLTGRLKHVLGEVTSSMK